MSCGMYIGIFGYVGQRPISNLSMLMMGPLGCVSMSIVLAFQGIVTRRPWRILAECNLLITLGPIPQTNSCVSTFEESILIARLSKLSFWPAFKMHFECAHPLNVLFIVVFGCVTRGAPHPIFRLTSSLVNDFVILLIYNCYLSVSSFIYCRFTTCVRFVHLAYFIIEVLPDTHQNVFFQRILPNRKNVVLLGYFWKISKN